MMQINFKKRPREEPPSSSSSFSSSSSSSSSALTQQQPPPPSEPATSAEDDLAALEKDSTRFDRVNAKEVEVKRILTAFKLDPVAILGVDYTATVKEVTKRYRKLSLLVHPDKFPADQRKTAETAFAKLSQARKDIVDEEKRKHLNEVLQQARINVAKRHGQGPPKPKKMKLDEYLEMATADMDADGNSKEEEEKPPEFVPQISAEMMPEVEKEVKQLLIDQEWKRRQLLKMNSRIDGRAAKEVEEKAKARAAEKAAEKAWEDSRDSRVNSWRNFNQKAKKKSKKKKKHMKGAITTTNLVVDDDKPYIKRVKKF